MKHRWGEPQRFADKTERECLKGCGIIRVTRHRGGGAFPKIEFWRDLDRIECAATPVCEPVSAEVTS